jgi:hypothetical protein
MKKALAVIVGIVLGTVILACTAAVAGRLLLDRQVEGEVDAMLAAAEGGGKVVVESDLTGLPESVARYLEYAGVVGKKRIRTVRLTQTGSLVMSPGQPSMPLRAEQHYSVRPPGFIWYAGVHMKGFLEIRARDSYVDGKGSMLVTVLSLYPLVDASGPELDQGAMLRYLSEMPWFPTAYLEDFVEWEEIDAGSAKITMTRGGTSVEAVCTFNDEGQMVGFSAERYRSMGKMYYKETWSTPISGYTQLNGMNVPVAGSAVWKLEGGDFEYIKVKIDEIEYGVE